MAGSSPTSPAEAVDAQRVVDPDDVPIPATTRVLCTPAAASEKTSEPTQSSQGSRPSTSPPNCYVADMSCCCFLFYFDGSAVLRPHLTLPPCTSCSLVAVHLVPLWRRYSCGGTARGVGKVTTFVETSSLFLRDVPSHVLLILCWAA